MRLKIKNIIASILCIAAIRTAAAQEAADTTDCAVRETPQLEFSDEELDVIPPFIKQNENRIELNGADWSNLRHKAAHTDSATLTIVHIGDSHIQADFSTGKTRALMQAEYGNAGRGLIVPLKLAGTNEPRDYIIKSTSKWHGSKLLKQNENAAPGFTGVGISPVCDSTSLTIATLSRTGNADPFNRLKIYHSGTLFIDSVSSQDSPIAFSATYTDSVTTVTLPQLLTEVSLALTTGCGTSISGIVLSNGKNSGVLYHAIGNNGATYHCYNMLPAAARKMGDINPDLIIVSLGANEAFGKQTDDEIYRSIDTFVTNIRQSYPASDILLTTPMECQKSTRVRRKGKKHSRRTYTVNERILAVRNIIARYGDEHGIPVYDWYEIAGGTGASRQWVNDGLMAKDRIHHSYKGYRLHGALLYDALKNSLR